MELGVRSNALRLKEACVNFLEECIRTSTHVPGLEELDSEILKEVVVNTMKKRGGEAASSQNGSENPINN